METTDDNLYAELHPDHTDREARRVCLDYLRERNTRWARA